MSEIKRILYPTDFSRLSARALPHVSEIACKCGAEVTMLHVLTPTSQPSDHLAHHLQWMLETTPRLTDSHFKVTAAVVEAKTADAGVLDFISDSEVDLTIMGTHGRSPLTHFFLGSVTERVLRHASCPVLTVGEESEERSQSAKYENILVGFDFSSDSASAARCAVFLANCFGARVQVLHVIEQESRPDYFDAWQDVFVRELPQITSKARELLCNALRQEGLENVDACVRAAQGRAHQEIVRFASEHQADLLVLGAHGLGDEKDSPLGTNTERTIRTASLPVLTIKPAKEQ